MPDPSCLCFEAGDLLHPSRGNEIINTDYGYLIAYRLSIYVQLSCNTPITHTLYNDIDQQDIRPAHDMSRIPYVKYHKNYYSGLILWVTTV